MYVYVCMYVCMYAWMYVCMYASKYRCSRKNHAILLLGGGRIAMVQQPQLHWKSSPSVIPYSYWKRTFIVKFPIKKWWCSIVYRHFPMVFLWLSRFPIVFLWFFQTYAHVYSEGGNHFLSLRVHLHRAPYSRWGPEHPARRPLKQHPPGRKWRASEAVHLEHLPQPS